MIVYSISFEFDREAEMQKAEAIVADWVSRRARTRIDALALWEEPARELRRDIRLDAWQELSDQPRVRALALRCPDGEVPGRSWITEIGFRDDWSRAVGSMSLTLAVDDASALVGTRPEVSRPKCIEDLVQACGFARYVPGPKPKEMVDADAARFLRHLIADTSRDYAIVLLSAAGDGRLPADPARLSSLLAGLAEVVVIPADADTFAIGRVLGNRFRTVLGAVHVIFPNGNRKLLPREIEALRARGVAVEDFLLSLVTDRTNALHLRRHVSPEQVRCVIARRAIERSRLQALESDERAAYASWLEGEVIRIEQRNAELLAARGRLEERAAGLELKLASSQKDVDRLRYQVDALQLSLRAAPDRRRVLPDLCAAREAARAVVKGTATPQQVLSLVAALYSDRVVILESARKAARDAAHFGDPRRLFERLSVLCDYYWDELVSGKGDTEARKLLGGWYAAHEVESVEKSRIARRQRTFEYKGIPVEMMQHIKIGMKESEAETMRTYFGWDAEDRKIVIGHCGRHFR